MVIQDIEGGSFITPKRKVVRSNRIGNAIKISKQLQNYFCKPQVWLKINRKFGEIVLCKRFKE
jgi:hypothetical protein